MNHLFRQVILCTFLSCTATAIEAADVTTSAAGQLASLVSNPQTETSLRVSGPVNAVDFLFIAKEMPRLKTLDLAGATIAGCEISSGLSHTVYAENLVPQAAFAGSPVASLSLPQTGKLEIGDMAFAGSALKTLTLNDNVAKVGMGAFSSCNELEQANISKSAHFGSHAFASCNSLTAVSLNGIDAVSEAMFASCPELKTVGGTENLKYIGPSAFAACLALDTFVFGNSLQTVGDGAFSSTALAAADLSACDRLTSIGDWAFSFCKELSSIALPAKLKHIGKGAFFDCRSLAAVDMPETTETIGDYALKGLENVSELEIPAATHRIGTLAMSGMNSLKNIHAENVSDVPALGDDVWDRLAKEAIALHVDQDMVSRFEDADQWQDFDIVAEQSSISDAVVPTGGISARLDGNTLRVRADEGTLAELYIYDIAGRRFLGNGNVAAEQTEVDLSQFADKIFVVCASTDAGVRMAIKIVRK